MTLINRFKKTALGMSLLSYLFFLGCVPGPLFSWVEDVSNDKSLWGGYNVGGVYRINTDMFLLISIDPPEIEQEALVAPRQATMGNYMLLYSAPESISEYKKNKKKWPEVKGIIGARRKIKCIRILKYTPLAYESSIYVQAKIIDGPFAGQVVEISDLSISKYDKKSEHYLLSPNPELLSYLGMF